MSKYVESAESFKSFCTLYGRSAFEVLSDRFKIVRTKVSAKNSLLLLFYVFFNLKSWSYINNLGQEMQLHF